MRPLAAATPDWTGRDPTIRYRSYRRIGIVAVVLVILVDQVPLGLPPSPGATFELLAHNRRVVSQLDRALPRGAMVFQLPIVSYPEAGYAYRLDSYELLLPYIFGPNTLRWSFGGIRGREADWQLNWGDEDPRMFVTGLALVGYDAVTLSRDGFVDDGRSITTALAPLVGRPHDADRRIVWYNLRPLRRNLERSVPQPQLNEARRLLLHSPVAEVVNEAQSLAPPRPGMPMWFEGTSSVEVHNPLAGERPVRLTLTLSARVASWVRLDGPGLHRTLQVGTSPRTFSIPVTLRSAHTSFDVHTDAPIDFAAPMIRPQLAYSATVRVDRLEVVDPLVHATVSAAAPSR